FLARLRSKWQHAACSRRRSRDMDELQQQLPPDLAELAEQFASAAAPFESERDEDATAGGHTAMLEVAGFLVGVVGLLVSLIGVYTSGTEARRKRVPDFEEL